VLGPTKVIEFQSFYELIFYFKFTSILSLGTAQGTLVPLIYANPKGFFFSMYVFLGLSHAQIQKFLNKLFLKCMKSYESHCIDCIMSLILFLVAACLMMRPLENIFLFSFIQ